jgi:hypothetical protein
MKDGISLTEVKGLEELTLKEIEKFRLRKKRMVAEEAKETSTLNFLPLKVPYSRLDQI